MKELFKWMASHPEIAIEIEHDNVLKARDGYLQITMRHKFWNTFSREVIIYDLIDIATNPDEILISTLDHHYRKLIEEKNKSIDQRIDEILEVHNENCEHE